MKLDLFNLLNVDNSVDLFGFNPGILKQFKADQQTTYYCQLFCRKPNAPRIFEI